MVFATLSLCRCVFFIVCLCAFVRAVGPADGGAGAEEAEDGGEQPADRVPAGEDPHQEPHTGQGREGRAGGKGLALLVASTLAR